MARSRRRMATPPRRRRRADWVYRGNVWLADGSVGDARGSYHSVSTAVPTGAANASGKILYDSINYLQESVGIVPIGAQLHRAGRAEGRRPLCHRVQGHVIVQPQTWALGSQLNVAQAIIISAQDANSGAPLVEAAFSLWDSVAGDPQSQPNVYANWTGVLHVQRLSTTFSDNASFFRFRWNHRVNRRLNSNECLWLYTEASAQSGTSASVNVNIVPWCRTLVSDEG